ncbi:hypothetical protein [Georgenia sp. MJ170]|uniref:hypothetical protein n=1 Tax=Georgenia sunbinii TaxID=3117728 RepID=UPI002F2647A6
MLITATILSSMSVIGVVVVPNGKQPRVHAVILGGTLDEPRYVDKFELRTSSTEPSEQTVDLALSLSSRLSSLTLAGAGIRIAGTPPVARRNRAVFSRAHCEGAMLFVLREALGVAVATIDPAGAPKAFGITKDQFEERRDQMASAGANADAVVGALAALANL